MENIEHKRRANDFTDSAPAVPTTDIVRHGILMQQAASTVAAVEFLAARGIDAAVIRRVMAGEGLREGDRLALARQQREPGRVAPLTAGV